MTFDLGSRSKVMAPNESPYMISYMSTIQTESISLTVFEIFEKRTHMTFDLGSRSKFNAPNESPYTISYMSTIQMESLSFIVFEKKMQILPFVICDLEFWCLRLLKVKGHGTNGKAIHKFILADNTNCMSILKELGVMMHFVIFEL